jgi:hypothetical protein
VDEVLQPAGLAFQQNQKLVGFAHPAHFVPSAAQGVRAVPDQCRQDDGDGAVQCREQEQTPSDRQRPHKALGLKIEASPRPGTRHYRLLVIDGDQIVAHCT